MENGFAPELVFIIHSLVCSLKTGKQHQIQGLPGFLGNYRPTQIRNTQYFSIPNSFVSISKGKQITRRIRVQKNIGTLWMMNTNRPRATTAMSFGTAMAEGGK